MQDSPSMSDSSNFWLLLRRAGVRIWLTLRDTLRSMSNARASEAAASISYYALFSLFPLLVFLVGVGGYLLSDSSLQNEILNWVQVSFPAAGTQIVEVIRQASVWQRPFGIVAGVSLLWSATSVFYSLALNLNRVYADAKKRGVIRNRFVALGMIGGILFLIVLLTALRTVLKLASTLDLPFVEFEPWMKRLMLSLVASEVPSLLLLLSVWTLYIYAANQRSHLLASIIGAFFTTTAWRLLNSGFVWYLGSNFNRYELIYGSLWNIVVLMLWIYLIIWILLFGAHLSGVITRQIQQKRRRSLQKVEPSWEHIHQNTIHHEDEDRSEVYDRWK